MNGFHVLQDLKLIYQFINNMNIVHTVDCNYLQEPTHFK